MSRPADAIVIGAGVVGAACACFLAQAGLRVVVYEARFAAAGCTAAGMGHLVVMDDSEEQFALTHYSLRLWEQLAGDLPADCELDRCGTLWVAEDDAQMQAVQSKHAFYAARGVYAEILDGRAVARCEPNLRAGLAGGLRVPGDSVLYPPGAARFLLERARSRGAELIEGAPVEAIRDRAVRVRGEWVEADVVVHAAGAEATALIPELPVVPRKGHLVITDRYPGFCRHQVVELGYLRSAHELSAESVAFNLQPRRTGQLLIGSSRELVGWDATVNPDVVRRMLCRAIHFLPGLASLSVIRSWTGFRPATPDKLPLVGRWDALEGVWVAVGHEGLGIATSVGTGKLLSDLIVGSAPGIDPAPFAPSRVHALAGGNA